jgi:V-type H+-transporting ATPase subunit E
VQGYLQLLEPSVTVYTRPQDVGVAKQAAAAAVRAYKDISGRDVQFDVEGTLNKDRYACYAKV